MQMWQEIASMCYFRNRYGCVINVLQALWRNEFSHDKGK